LWTPSYPSFSNLLLNLALLIIARVEPYLKFSLDHHSWAHFLFIQNFFPDYINKPTEPRGADSLLVARHRRTVLSAVADRGLVLPATQEAVWRRHSIQFAASHFLASADRTRYSSFMRADAILLGVLLSLVCKEPFIVEVSQALREIDRNGGNPAPRDFDFLAT
jgi:hypothetical protein